MEADYATKVTDLDKQQAEARSQSIGNMFSTMTGAAATFFGQQSAMYRAAFAMEKAYAVYKAVMNVRETYSNTYNSVAAIPVIGPYIAAPTAAALSASLNCCPENTPLPTATRCFQTKKFLNKAVLMILKYFQILHLIPFV